eukprot:scaffold42332_cov63-Phaeocystis_antarctica.AAC.6
MQMDSKEGPWPFDSEEEWREVLRDTYGVLYHARRWIDVDITVGTVAFRDVPHRDVVTHPPTTGQPRLCYRHLLNPMVHSFCRCLTSWGDCKWCNPRPTSKADPNPLDLAHFDLRRAALDLQQPLVARRSRFLTGRHGGLRLSGSAPGKRRPRLQSAEVWGC